MLNIEKSKLRSINKIDKFNDIIKKLTICEELTKSEQTYILSCAIVFFKYFEQDKRCTSYLEFAYFIILKYSLQYEDYQALYDFSVNFGFYPIAKNINDNNLLKSVNINKFIIDITLERYRNSNYIETYEQKNIREGILRDNSKEISYIAPTSYGKSSIIIEHIRKNYLENKKVAIIVPTKSLLMQTYRMVRESNINRRILIHDEMYKQDSDFIAILTQERALRLIKDKDIYFDILYIDEAHNIFNKDLRNILLSRVIRKNLKRNINQKVIYLSPFISDSDNLKISCNQDINEQKVNYNIKEAEIYEYCLDGDILKYNRFVDKFYNVGSCKNLHEYIDLFKKNKNFIYIRSPKKIEIFAIDLFTKIEDIDKNTKIQEVIDELVKYVHKDFYVNKLLEKGIVYLHGKIPDVIKEYLEYKYRQIEELKYLVANKVILEGINMPIDTLFILNTYGLNHNELTNLIGRVNRLDKIFTKDSNNLEKLLPRVHFINSELYNKVNSNMKSKIRCLRNKMFDDVLENPTLYSFDIDKLKLNKSNREMIIKNLNLIKENEMFLLEDSVNEVDSLKQDLIESGIAEMYKITDEVIKELFNRIEQNKNILNGNETIDIVDNIYDIFIKDIEEIKDYELSRLEYEEARNYYKVYIKNSNEKTLKENINFILRYFKYRISQGNSLFYIGNSYGEIVKNTQNYKNNGGKVYVDLSKKSEIELINLAIVKLKIESDFISYKLIKFVKFMYDYELINEEEYNKFIYGTTDSQKISLIKTGLTINLINRLDKDNQLKNIFLDENNNIKSNSEFQIYKDSLNDLYKFELSKFL